jgi:hypothetical protein
MMREGLKYFTEIPMMVSGMLIFFSVYLGILVFTLSGKKTKSRMQQNGTMPLHEDELV